MSAATWERWANALPPLNQTLRMSVANERVHPDYYARYVEPLAGSSTGKWQAMVRLYGTDKHRSCLGSQEDKFDSRDEAQAAAAAWAWELLDG